MCLCKATGVKYITVFCGNVTHAAQSCGRRTGPGRAGTFRPIQNFSTSFSVYPWNSGLPIGPWSGPGRSMDGPGWVTGFEVSFSSDVACPIKCYKRRHYTATGVNLHRYNWQTLGNSQSFYCGSNVNKCVTSLFWTPHLFVALLSAFIPVNLLIWACLAKLTHAGICR